jgi:hypothetical protein
MVRSIISWLRSQYSPNADTFPPGYVPVPYPHVAHAEFVAIIQVVLEAALYQAFIVKGA